MNKSLYSKSIEIILANESVWGSYVASPTFPTYSYCWLRDGSFIAHAMDTVKEFTSAEAFFRWVARTIQKYGVKVEDIRHHLEIGLPFGKDDVLHTRFTLDGNEVTEDSAWGNFQIDGYGTWLWALAEHVHRSGNTFLLKELAEAVQITLQYLQLVWKLPNYDCWEEHPEAVHPYSLATVYAGFNRMAAFAEVGLVDNGAIPLSTLANQVKEYIQKFAVLDGHLVKHIWPARSDDSPKPIAQSGVDSSLIGISVPFNVLSPDNPLMLSTIQAIENDLHRRDGGVYRYKADVYYGGGEWLLLSAWLGWYYTQVGAWDRADELRNWMESQSDEDGLLAEQSSAHLLDPDHFGPWVEKWGQVAKPLLWSHAMYIILVNALRQRT